MWRQIIIVSQSNIKPDTQKKITAAVTSCLFFRMKWHDGSQQCDLWPRHQTPVTVPYHSSVQVQVTVFSKMKPFAAQQVKPTTLSPHRWTKWLQIPKLKFLFTSKSHNGWNFPCTYLSVFRDNSWWETTLMDLHILTMKQCVSSRIETAIKLLRAVLCCDKDARGRKE